MAGPEDLEDLFTVFLDAVKHHDIDTPTMKQRLSNYLTSTSSPALINTEDIVRPKKVLLLGSGKSVFKNHKQNETNSISLS